MSILTFIALAVWTFLTMGFTSLLINLGIRRRLKQRFFLPQYTATLLTDCLMMDSDKKWTELGDMGIGIKYDD